MAPRADVKVARRPYCGSQLVGEANGRFFSGWDQLSMLSALTLLDG